MNIFFTASVDKRNSKFTRLSSMILALVIFISCFAMLSVSAYAAESRVVFNVSQNQCQGNLSSYTFPDSATTLYQGNYYYINTAGTSDFKFDRLEVYIMAPGQSTYSLVDSYDPSGYFRWYYLQYKFSQEGTYYIKLILTLTNGTQGRGEVSFYVNGNNNGSQNSSSTDTYQYDSKTFNVVPNFKSEYFFNQNDYSRFVNNHNKNRGCTATAMCIAYSIYHDTTLSPNDVKWCSAGTSWEYCTRYEENGYVYKGYTYTQNEALKCAYNCISSGKPMIIGVNGAGSDHVITAVGIREGADFDNLSLSDILIIDPNGGDINTLAKYNSIDTGWGLRIPID